MSNLNNNTAQLEALLAKVNALPEAGSGGTDTSDATATANDILSGKTAYVRGEKITGNIAFQPAQTITPGTTNQTIASGKYLTGVQTIKGDANLVASNIISGKSIFGVMGTATAGGGGDTSVEDGLITRQVTSCINDRVTTIGNYAFYSCSRLTTASFPNVTSIGNSAFAYCSRLTTASFPNVTSIGNSAFTYCSSLTTASFPNVISIGNYTFARCSSLTTASFPNVTSISTYAFAFCYSLTTASFPNLTSIGNLAFASCYSLTTASFPKVTSIGNSAFTYCSSLTTASFPNVISIGNYAFARCSSLTTASFPNVVYIGSYAFSQCSRLKSFYLMSTRVCSLLNSTAFINTPIANWSSTNGGRIYVPASLVNAYKSATNWAYYSGAIVGI